MSQSLAFQVTKKNASKVAKILFPMMKSLESSMPLKEKVKIYLDATLRISVVYIEAWLDKDGWVAAKQLFVGPNRKQAYQDAIDGSEEGTQENLHLLM